MSENYEPSGVDFYDASSSREMRLVTDGHWSGWLVYRHASGNWVTLREATEADRVAIRRANELRQRRATGPPFTSDELRRLASVVFARDESETAAGDE